MLRSVIAILLFATSLAAQSAVQLAYLGTAGWQITSGRTVILIDPYLSRVKMRSPNDDVSPDDPRPLVNANSVVEPDTAVIDAHIQRADYILLTHSHTDHSLDMPYIARKTGALVMGTESTANLARAEGVPDRQIKSVIGGEDLQFDGFSVRVIPSLHGIFRRPQSTSPAPVAPPLIPADLKAPVRLGQHVEGGTLAYLIRIGGHQIIVFGSMNYIERELTGLRPDVALIGAMPERNNIDDYTPRLLRALGNPRLVIPTHWDRFNVPHSVSQRPAIDRLQSFLAEVKAVSPETRVIVPEYFKPIPLDAALAPQPSQRGGAGSPFPGGANPDGSLRPTPPVNRLFTQDAYTEYSILAPGSEQFRIRFWPEENRAGATELVNATRGGSEGTDIEVYDPRTGKPLKFTYQQQGDDPESHAIHAMLPMPVPEGGVGRVLIYKTYKDPRTYMMHGDDIVWVRSLSGYRLGVVLPKGFAFLSSNVAAQLTTLTDGRLKLAFANPSGQSNPVTIHARKTAANFTPLSYTDIFFDDIKTLYDLDAPQTHTIRVEQIYSDFRKGDKARLDSLVYIPLQDLKVIDLDTAKPFSPTKDGSATVVKLEVPIVDERQSAHIKITGALKDPDYTVRNGDLVFDRTLRGLRNTVLLPSGWEVAAVSQSATIGTYQGRAFVSLINLNAENNYRVVIHARKP